MKGSCPNPEKGAPKGTPQRRVHAASKVFSWFVRQGKTRNKGGVTVRELVHSNCRTRRELVL